MPEGGPLFRVDPRLVHATLMNAWVPQVDATRIVIADERVEKNTRRRHILQMSSMDAVPLEFCSEGNLPTLLQGASSSATIVLFSDLAGVERAIDAGAKLDELKIGHIPEAPGSFEVHPAVYLAPDDMKAIERLENAGVKVLIQPLPSDEKKRPDLSNRKQVKRKPLPRGVSKGGSREVAAETHFLQQDDAMVVEDELLVVNERGLHLRAAHVLAALATKLESDVRVGREGYMVNAKSLLGLTTLGASRGSKLRVVVTGPTAKEDMEAMRRLFASGFDEGGST